LAGSDSGSEPDSVADGGRPFRIALGFEYDGGAYNGWQSQPHAPSVQETLAAAATRVANEDVSVIGAGRTDTGVHATLQVAHFDTHAERSEESWRRGINTHLPDDINVHWARPVSHDFHARFSATARAYRYLILNRKSMSALDRNRVWSVTYDLDLEAMQKAAECLAGKHDFSSFRASSCQAHTPVRTMSHVSLSKEGSCILFDIRGDAFLHHMVRNLMGTLVTVGRGDKPASWVAEVLEARDRKLAGITAPPQGLYLTDVTYPDEFGLPKGGWAIEAATRYMHT